MADQEDRQVDNDYVTDTTRDGGDLPVQSDDTPINDPIDAEKADSDETLAADENEAIDKSNILGERTRGAAQPAGTYREPGDEEGLPGPEEA
ncbi:hypothetical protein UCRPC4_g03061 [Phaeomoniella chlamydospora]|uniref:Histone chaperone domain-containing protein n=1 Tax=Phaeomoniella chlamydospora TaxID=158046 RepID=A0A0G2EL57_PHACM|nr:hypothetical protein UCRPC4_g03061 [Phaeomoniella chlamydospora]